METFAKADIFFFTTTICVVILTISLAALIFYVMYLLRKIEKISNKIERGIDTASEQVKDMIENAKENSFFQFILSKIKNRKKRSK